MMADDVTDTSGTSSDTAGRAFPHERQPEHVVDAASFVSPMRTGQAPATSTPGPTCEKLSVDEWLSRELMLAAQGQALPQLQQLPQALPAVDLRTLLSEITALKSEVRAETQASREVRNRLDKTGAMLEERLADQQRREASLAAALDLAQATARQRACDSLIDLCDRLEVSLEQCTVPRRRWYSFIHRVGRGNLALVATREGLCLTLHRAQEHLLSFGAERTTTVGLPFDGEIMEAVDTVCDVSKPNFTVVDEVTAGYQFHNGQQLRRAQVVVNRHT